MKKSVLASWLVLMVTSSAFGIYDPNWERPILGDHDMKIEAAQFGFEDVTQAGLTLTKRDGQTEPTGILVNLNDGGAVRSIQLTITSIEKDASCGSVRYVASLGKQSKSMGARFNVVLEDHTTRVCDDARPGIWEANLREGYGWCGTGDATLYLVGNPEPLYTIQSLR